MVITLPLDFRLKPMLSTLFAELKLREYSVLVTPTSDLGKILSCMHGGEMNLAAGIQVAQLALKNRQIKSSSKGLLSLLEGAFLVLSPVTHDKKALEMIGKKLKKNSVALDIVHFGEDDEGKTEKLEALLAAVNNNDTSHIVHVPAGPNALSDVLTSTPIFTGDGEGGSGFAASATAAAAAAGGISGFEFGVDPNLDPELALALRVSMEEERARQEAAAKKEAEEASEQDATMTERASEGPSEADNKKNGTPDDDNALLQQALAMSVDEPASSQDLQDTEMSDAAAEDPELALVEGVYVKYDTGARIVTGKLNVHLVPHSHDDGACVQNVLDLVVEALRRDPNRKFVSAEMAFFQRWWTEQSPEIQEQVKKLVDAGQLEFVHGGWFMHDEAATHYIDMIDQTTLGHRTIKEQFNKVPRAGWQIDPFGHSSVQGYLLGAEVGFDSVHFARVDYQDREQRKNDKSLEVIWRGSNTFGSSSQGPPTGFHFEVNDDCVSVQADDSKGVEVLDERVFAGTTSEGLTKPAQIRGNYYVSVNRKGEAAQWRRTTGQEVYSPLLLALTHEKTETLKSSHLTKATACHGSRLSSFPLKPAVSSAGTGCRNYSRPAHLYEEGEDSTYSKLAKVELKKTFNARTIKEVKETSLTTNQVKSEMKKLSWKVEGKNGKEASPVRGGPLNNSTLIVELGLMEIRTFFLKF
ncbi:26S proteasome non-ATPase regulatory subunit 4-like protein [Hibiscus syriacus]|uniref:26S proteasome non-ATPase regulatory subunit 4-like protein n=1 Tax=Hibiscus syriacus TaxID=106335 RepID=A0A6A3ATM9_HIBSY|nr:26S proteasome non-ATPase regulatory subunit 4-like protein [Hibiscus syriacus]